MAETTLTSATLCPHTVPPCDTEDSSSTLEIRMLRAVAEAAKLRLEVADLRAEIAALKAAPRLPDARAATIGACRRVALPGWTPGSCDTCAEPIPGWTDTLDASIALTSFVKAPTFLYRCTACNAKHMAAVDAHKAAEALDERRRERVDLLRAAWSSMPPGDRDLSMATVRATGRVADPSRIERLARVDMGPAPKRRVVTLYGHTGSGKTTLALAWVEDIVRAGEDLDADASAVRRAASARHVTASELAGARKRAALGREAPVVEDALRASALVIDELGGEPMADQAVIEEVVFARIAAGRPTVVTTGLDREQIGERYRAGLVRRIILDKTIALSIEMTMTPRR